MKRSRRSSTVVVMGGRTSFEGAPRTRSLSSHTFEIDGQNQEQVRSFASLVGQSNPESRPVTDCSHFVPGCSLTMDAEYVCLEVSSHGRDRLLFVFDEQADCLGKPPSPPSPLERPYLLVGSRHWAFTRKSYGSNLAWGRALDWRTKVAGSHYQRPR